MPLSSTGFRSTTLDEVINETSSDLRSDVSPALDLSASSPDGQEVRIFARQIRRLWEGLEALYSGFSRTASGDMLRQIAALTGTYQRGAAATSVTTTVTLESGTYAANSLTAHPSGRPDILFRNRDTITQAADGTASAVFVATETGPISPGTLVIGSPVAGWSAIVTGVVTLGRDIESEAALRLRRENELTAQGAATVDSIRADILRDYPQAVSVTVLENDTLSTVDGIPGKSIECIVQGPAVPTPADNQSLAELIFRSKSGGIEAHGNTDVTVRDSQGNSHVIGLTRPVERDYDEIALAVVVDPSAYIGDAAAQARIVQTMNARSAPGVDITWSAVVSAALGVPGVLRVTNVALGGFLLDVPINIRQYYFISGINDGFTSTPGTP